VALRDAAKDVAKLKQEDGPPLITQGSAELVHSLLAAGLVDEATWRTRIATSTGPDAVRAELVATRCFPSA